jgi:hypothetical protein
LVWFLSLRPWRLFKWGLRLAAWDPWWSMSPHLQQPCPGVHCVHCLAVGRLARWKDIPGRWLSSVNDQ